MKITPKVNFRIVKLDETMPIIHRRLRTGPNSMINHRNRMLRAYPDLEAALGNKAGEELKNAEREYFREFMEREYPIFEAARAHFQTEWDKVQTPLLSALSEVMEQPWAKRDKIMGARVGLCPTCPRFIDEREFEVFYRYDSRKAISTCLHEILHFIWFDKWKSVFPEAKREEFEQPHIVWQLSEMVPCAVLNDEKIQKVFPHFQGIHDRLERYSVNGQPLRAYLQGMYAERKDMPDFMRKGYAFVKEHEQEILSLK